MKVLVFTVFCHISLTFSEAGDWQSWTLLTSSLPDALSKNIIITKSFMTVLISYNWSVFTDFGRIDTVLVIDRTLFLPNRTELFFCRTIVRPTELCSAKTAERVRQMGHISAERSVRPNVRFGSVFAERVRGSVDHYKMLIFGVAEQYVLAKVKKWFGLVKVNTTQIPAPPYLCDGHRQFYWPSGSRTFGQWRN